MTESTRVQVGWMNPDTGVMCDCPVYEVSPHAKSVPIYRELPASGSSTGSGQS